MATIIELKQQFVEAYNRGDEQAARALAREIKARQKAVGADEKPMDPTAGMTGGEKFLAGAGKAFYDVGRGVGQAVGLVSDEDVAEARRLDAPLMNTGSGMVGNIAGSAALMAPFAAIPGANTVVGSTALGAAFGAAQPVVGDESRFRNTLVGGALGGAIPAALTAGRTLKSVAIDPFRQSGQEAIAGRVLQQFARDPKNVTRGSTYRSPVGSLPTLAETSGDEGIAQLQRVVQTQHPQAGAQISARFTENNAKRIGALEEMAGTGGARESAIAARDAAANRSYGKAFEAGIDPKVAASLQPQIENLIDRIPPIAMAQARRLARMEGIALNEFGNVRGLHYVKKAIDDLLDNASMTGIGKNSRRALTVLKEDLLSVLDELSPGYAAARSEFEQLSRPINQMEVADRLLNTTTSAMRDFQGNPRLHGEAFARSLRNEGQLIEKATGMARGLDETMTPRQMMKLRAIEQELSMAANSQTAGKVSGSPTAQYLVGQDILRRTAGPLGLPKSWVASQFAQNAIARPMSWAHKVPEERIMGILGDAMLDPQMAAALLARAQQPGPVQQVLQRSPKVVRGLLEAAGDYAQVMPQAALPAY